MSNQDEVPDMSAPGCDCSLCVPPPDDEPRCVDCGYTAADARVHGDHHMPYCGGTIPKRKARGKQ